MRSVDDLQFSQPRSSRSGVRARRRRAAWCPRWRCSPSGRAAPAAADLTAFLGVSPSPDTHLAKGAAVGMGLVIIGFEFEYSQLGEDAERAVPSLTTGSGNLLVQTPVPINGWQFYAALGGGLYRERLELCRDPRRHHRRAPSTPSRAFPPLRLPHLLALGRRCIEGPRFYAGQPASDSWPRPCPPPARGAGPND